MPTTTQTYSKQLEKLLGDSDKLFASLFNNDRISRREQDWLTFDDQIRTASERSKLLKQRLEQIQAVCKMAWSEPWHITGSMPKYRSFDTIEQAIAAYSRAYYDYTTRLEKYSIGNLVVQVEIGFNLVDNEPKFNLHFHALMEKVGYDRFLRNTEHCRRGRKPNSWEFYTKHNPRDTTKTYKNQTNVEYLFAQARYLTKFSILQGDTRKSETGFASRAMPDQADIAEKLLALKQDHPILLRRIVVSSRFVFSDTYSWLKKQINRLTTIISTLRLFTRLFEKVVKQSIPAASNQLKKLAKRALGLLPGGQALLAPPRPLSAEDAYLMDAYSD